MLPKRLFLDAGVTRPIARLLQAEKARKAKALCGLKSTLWVEEETSPC